ncbi:MAG: hypothetical protein IT350_18255 [Deltaproteobacteria bacterium]|nr:hypothetical protein [Deltaproteobacteria bacterium]
MDAPITEHRFRVRTDGEDRVLTVARPHTRVVSSEYYFTYTRTANVSVREPLPGEEIPEAADRFVPQAYAPHLIKMARVDFDGATSVDPSAMARLVAMIAAKSTQFPLLVLDDLGSEKPLESLIDALRPLTERDDMYFFLLVRSRELPGGFDEIFARHRDIFYSSRNRIYLKALLEHDGDAASSLARMRAHRERGIDADLLVTLMPGDAAPELPDLSEFHRVHFDDYSERDIVEGPNVWIDIRGRVEPATLVDVNRACLSQGLRREFLQPSLQRLFNGFATRRAGGIRGTMVFALDGSAYLDDLGERVRLGSWRDESAEELLARQSPDCGCGEDGGDCGELRYFCLRSAPGCAYLQSVVTAMARAD